MTPLELVNHIRSGPVTIVFDETLPRFRRRTRSNPCDFKEFLRALQCNQTIKIAECGSHLRLGVSEGEWVRLVMTLGSIKGMKSLKLDCSPGSCNFRLFQAVAEAVNNAHSLRELFISLDSLHFPKDPSGIIKLASALREHSTLQAFCWGHRCSRVELQAAQTTALDPVLQALPACPHLREVSILTHRASADTMIDLLQSQSVTGLQLIPGKKNWLKLADEIRGGRCNILSLDLSMIHRDTESDATEAVKAIASAIRSDKNLELLILQMENGFTDEAGVALAEALTVNTTLYQVNLSAVVHNLSHVHNVATFGAHSYEAFAAMLRINSSLVLKLPPPLFTTYGRDENLVKHYDLMRIEQRLNIVGRGSLILLENDMVREDWLDALYELSSFSFGAVDLDDSPALRISCVYSLLRLNPDIVV
jgi:hypothetical protein